MPLFVARADQSRFEGVTDRFLVELGPIAEGRVPKDSDFKYEYLVKGLRRIELKV